MVKIGDDVIQQHADDAHQQKQRQHVDVDGVGEGDVNHHKKQKTQQQPNLASNQGGQAVGVQRRGGEHNDHNRGNGDGQRDIDEFSIVVQGDVHLCLSFCLFVFLSFVCCCFTMKGQKKMMKKRHCRNPETNKPKIPESQNQ